MPIANVVLGEDGEDVVAKINAVITKVNGQADSPSANGKTLISAADYAAMRTLLGLVVGTNVQAYSAILAGTSASFTTALLNKLNAIASGATANATDAQLRARASHTGEQAISTVTGLTAALAAKADSTAVAAAIAAAISALDFEDGADVTDAGNVGSAIHGVAAKAVPADNDELALIDSQASNALKRLTWAALLTALRNALDPIYADDNDLVRTAGDTGRPGDSPLAYGTAITGKAEAIGAVLSDPAFSVVDDSSLGRALQVENGAKLVAKRQPMAVLPGRVYRATYRLRRFTDPADPLSSSVEWGMRYLNADGTGVAGGSGNRVINTNSADTDIVVADGVIHVQKTFSLDVSGVDYPIPTGTAAMRPWVRTYGTDHRTRIAICGLEDITDAFFSSGETSDAVETLTDQIAAETAARIAAIAALIGGAPSDRNTLGEINTALVAEVAARIAAVAAEASARAALVARIDALKLSLVIGRPVPPVTSAQTLLAGTFVFDAAVSETAYLATLTAYALAATTIQIKRFTRNGDMFTQVGQDFPVDLSVGLNTLSIAALAFTAQPGEYIGFWTPSGVITRTTGVSGDIPYFYSAGNVSSFTDASADPSQRLEIGLTFKMGAVADIDAVVDELSLSTTIGRPADPVTAAQSLVAGTFVFDATTARGGYLKSVRAYSLALGTILLKRFTRDGDVFTQVGPDLPVTLLTGPNAVTNGLSSFAIAPGEYVGFWTPAGLIPRTTGVSGDSPYFYSAGNVSTFTDTSADPSQRLEIGFDFEGGTVPAMDARLSEVEGRLDADTIGDTITAASVQIFSLTVNTAVTLERDGWPVDLTDTRTLAAPSGSNIRYDQLYLDGETMTFGLAAGTARLNDPTAFMGAASSPKAIPIYNLRVTATNVSDAVPIWTLDANGDVRSAVPAAEAMRRHARRLMPKTRGIIRRLAPLRLATMSDSIEALQSQGPSSTTPNGPYRDRATAALSETNHYLRDRYGADVCDAIPLYTATALGRADDGAGAVHTRIGIMWEAVAALEAMGYTLGTDLWYDNWSVAGWSTANAVSAGTATSWLNAVATGNANLVYVKLGMNELGSTDTEANLIVIANTLRDAGKEVVLASVPRRKNVSAANWLLTNRAIANAARKADVAHLSFAPVAEDRYVQGIGIAMADSCAANGSNHPGLEELKAYGREWAKVLTG